MPKTDRRCFNRRPAVNNRQVGEPMDSEHTAGSSREYLRLLFSAAAERMGGEHEREIRDFIVSVFQLAELLRAFRRSPRGKICGARGVAAQLNVSRNAIYVWLNSLELDAKDLRSAADLTELLHKSPVLRATVMKLLPQGLTCK